MTNIFLTSMVRNASLCVNSVTYAQKPRDHWQTGDFVVCEVIGKPTGLYRIEIVTGRRLHVKPGDLVVGALGRREATLEYVGDWRATGEDLRMHSLTAGGLFGKLTSASPLLSSPMQVLYRGHLTSGSVRTLKDTVEPAPAALFEMPVVVVFGSSMSAGKTTFARTIISELSLRGLRVAAAKMVGAAGHKDALTYADSGAAFTVDFVDAGLPSTACPEPELLAAYAELMNRIAASGCHVLVAELGGAPHDPYNGHVVLERLRPQVCLSVLAASDGYAASGVIQALGWKPDVIVGGAANTTSAIGMTEELTGVSAIDLASDGGLNQFRTLLDARLPAAPTNPRKLMHE